MEPMDPEIKAALDRGGIVDITTIGRRTGQPRRLEIYLHQFDGVYYLTGRPGWKRDWVANILAHPELTVHLKRGITADVAVVGEPEPDRDERGRILFRALTESWDSDPEKARGALDRWIDQAPFIRLRPVAS
jgi:deazaflavin-dependent oxidoreductase (nitroreductase family)